MFLNKFSCLAVLSFCLVACSPGEELARLELTDKAARVYVEDIAMSVDIWGPDYNWRMSDDGQQHILYVENYPRQIELEAFAARLQRHLDAEVLPQPEKVIYRIEPEDERAAKQVTDSGGKINQDQPLDVQWGQAEVAVYSQPSAIKTSPQGYGRASADLTCTYRFPVTQDIPSLSYKKTYTGNSRLDSSQFEGFNKLLSTMNALSPVLTIEHAITVSPEKWQPLFNQLSLQYAENDGLFWVSPKRMSTSPYHSPFSNNSYIADCENQVMNNAPIELLVLGGSMPLAGRINGFTISKSKGPQQP